MQEKAEQGIYPGRAPLGYRNNKLEHTIEIDPDTVPIPQRLFELYATGNYSLASLREAICRETGRKIPKSYLEKLLKNPFYCRLIYYCPVILAISTNWCWVFFCRGKRSCVYRSGGTV